MTIDPSADEGDQETGTPYGYVGNNPISRIDPNGKYAIPFAFEAIAEGVLYVATAYYGATVFGKAINKVLNLSPSSSYKPADFNKPLAPTKAQIAYMKAKLEDSNKTHGNKLDDKPAEGYSLRDKKTGEVKKYGETTRGEDKYGEGSQKRYSKKELKESGKKRKCINHSMKRSRNIRKRIMDRGLL